MRGEACTVTAAAASAASASPSGIVAHDPSFAGQVGVDAAEGADQLSGPAAHIATSRQALRATSG